jgi:hypothetical protein
MNYIRKYEIHLLMETRSLQNIFIRISVFRHERGFSTTSGIREQFITAGKNYADSEDFYRVNVIVVPLL